VAVCLGLTLAGPAFAQGPQPAEARRLMDDLLTETQPMFLRDAGAYPRPNRLLSGHTRPRPSPVAGVCEVDTFTILALPERERATPPGVDADAALIRGIESERRYQLSSEKPPPRTFPPALTPEKDCAALAGDPRLAFFAAPNPGAASVAGHFLAWLSEHPGELAAARCPPRGCPSRSAAAGLFRRSAIVEILNHDTCSRTRADCYSLLLRDGDEAWTVDFWAAYGTDRYRFGEVRFRRRPILVMD